MSVGLEVYDASGNKLVDPDTSMGRILGSVVSGTTGGSLVDADFAQGTPFTISLNVSGTNPPIPHLGPVITFSGTTMSWGTTTQSALILYGVH